MGRFAYSLFAVIVAAAITVGGAAACTGITLKADDHSVVYARTMELGVGVAPWNLIVVPRGTAYVGSTPWGTPGVNWKTKYAFAGVNLLGEPHVADGVNEAGLAVGVFMFARYAQYENVVERDAPKTLASYELATWLLSNFATAAEVKEGLAQVKVAPVVLNAPGWNEVPPFHWFVVDETGAAVIIEYTKDGLKVYDNPLGVITNAPTFDWHLTNLNNYVNLGPGDAASKDLGAVALAQLGHGSGLHGLPGDFTPPSRFVRAAFLKTAALPGKTGEEAVTQAFHVLNQFDITRGTVREAGPGGETIYEDTDWTSAADLKGRRYYVHAMTSRRVLMIDLMAAPLAAPDVMAVPLPAKEVFEDVTPGKAGE